MLHLSLYELVTASNNLKTWGRTLHLSRKNDSTIEALSEQDMTYLRDSTDTLTTVAMAIDMPVTADHARRVRKLIDDNAGKRLEPKDYNLRAMEDACEA